jgi:dipeptide/tripeptide permease
MLSISWFICWWLKAIKGKNHISLMSVFWLWPQFFLIGGAEVFTYVGQLEFFYDEEIDGTKSVSSAVFLSEEHRQLGR